ncbi:MAG: ABC transporter permease, partial [Patescibacteria group bacterium]
MKTLFKKELNYYLNNPLGYIVVILFAVFANFIYIKDIFVIGQASMKAFLGSMPWLLMIFIPAIAMRSFSEEKRNNTLESLLTLPVSESEIVVSKFLALLTLLAIALLLTLGLPIGLVIKSGLYVP